MSIQNQSFPLTLGLRFALTHSHCHRSSPVNEIPSLLGVSRGGTMRKTAVFVMSMGVCAILSTAMAWAQSHEVPPPTWH